MDDKLAKLYNLKTVIQSPKIRKRDSHAYLFRGDALFVSTIALGTRIEVEQRSVPACRIYLVVVAWKDAVCSGHGMLDHATGCVGHPPWG